MTDNALAQIARALELTKENSLRLADGAGDDFNERVRRGELVIGVDRSYGREFFARSDPAKIQLYSGINLRTPMRLALLAHMLEPPLLIASVALGFVVFGWWGFLHLAILFVAWQASTASNVTGPGSLSFLAIIGFVIALIFFAQGPAQHGWAAVGALIFAAHWYRYQMPIPYIRGLALTTAEMRRVLIECHVVTVRPTSGETG